MLVEIKRYMAAATAKSTAMTKRNRIAVISDAEPDDLVAIWMLLQDCKKRGVPAESIFVMSTLRDAMDSASVLDKIVHAFYPTVRVRVGTSGFKPPFKDVSGRLITRHYRGKEKHRSSVSQSSDVSPASQSSDVSPASTFTTAAAATEPASMGTNSSTTTSLATAAPAAASTITTTTTDTTILSSGSIDLLTFIMNSAKGEKTDLLLLAPAIDLPFVILSQIPAARIGGIWSWGGPNLQPTVLAQLATMDVHGMLPSVGVAVSVDIDDKSNSFNWRVESASTANFLEWAQRHSVPVCIVTPTIYQTSMTLNEAGIILGVHEDDKQCHKAVTALKTSRVLGLELIRIWIDQWNKDVPELVKKRCGIRDGALQFTPADPLAVAVYLDPTLAKATTAFCTSFAAVHVLDNLKSDGTSDDLDTLTLPKRVPRPRSVFVTEVDFNAFLTALEYAFASSG